ncbi:hybrid sensor histidine kinase/response regulator [Billgrantia endophytica]|uniref:histidine kinase n=1 Tax=Billgrantia endophytica TaxID=2033802 RepID=A0A2N7TYI9_9GAMM|nr:hybrid sensor histidine kinase/response regulator [Halomonas endophytica]PMR73258.1 hybrid sensor histidine kinase/response regulator [Halomonas endophytica]
MACISTRRSPGSPLDLVHPPELPREPGERERALQDENARLRRICASLIERVESGGMAGGAPYAAFEHSVLLAEQVRERTETLQRTLGELGQVNNALGQANAELGDVNAKLREEIAVRCETERRLRDAKAEAEAANLSKTKFLAAVSHDLLQPLNAARLFTSALSEHEVPADSQRLVGHIGRSLKDVETLLGTLVDISRLDAGVLKPDIAAFRVNELLDVLADEYRQIAAARNLELRYVCSNRVVNSDLALLARVIRNLLSNAIRYTERGRVLLGCRRRLDGLEILVADTGSGIHESQREEIFLEFRRGSAGKGQADRGLGLGLAIVDRITGMLGHRLSLVSSPDIGSQFSILVPYGQLDTVMTWPRHEPHSGTRLLEGARIWVIDNDPAICEGMEALLGGWGCRVTTSAGLSGLGSAPAPDMLIVDYHLTEGEPDGLEVAALVRERFPSLPVLVITANHDAALKGRAREQGFGCLLKPLKPLRLRMALLQHLSSHQRAQESG